MTIGLQPVNEEQTNNKNVNANDSFLQLINDSGSSDNDNDNEVTGDDDNKDKKRSLQCSASIKESNSSLKSQLLGENRIKDSPKHSTFSSTGVLAQSEYINSPCPLLLFKTGNIP